MPPQRRIDDERISSDRLSLSTRDPYPPATYADADGFQRRLRAWVRLPADDVTTPVVGEASPPKSLVLGTMPEEAHDMRTTRHPMRYVLPLVGMGLMLVGLFGSPSLPAASAAGVEPFAYQNHWGAQSPDWYQNPWGQQGYRGQRDPWGPQDPWGYRYDRPSRGPSNSRS
jgi:hypothetical protein